MTRPWIAILCLVGAASAAGRCGGEVLPRAPREMQSRLAQARDAAADGRFAHAVPLLEAILTSDQDGFIAADAPDAPQRTLKAEAAALLSEFPPEGLDQFEAWCGGKARRLLDEAVARRDRDALARVARQFSCTAAGAEAALVLGYDGLDRGQPLEALAWLGQLARFGAAARPCEPELTLATAVACLMADRPQAAADSLARLAALGPGVRFRIGDEEFTAADDPKRVLLALDRAVESGGPAESGTPAAWPMFRGDPARSGRAQWSGSIGPTAWKVESQARAAQSPGRSGVLSLDPYARSRQGVQLPASQPLLAGPLVLSRLPERLVAIDSRSGRQVWEFPWGGDAGLDGPSQPGGRAVSASMAAAVLAQRAYDDAPYGQIASDGDRVFLIDGLGRAVGQVVPVVMVVNGQQVISYTRPKPHNRLVALQLRKEGKLAWSVGGQSGEDEPGLAGAFFLGPPLAHEGRLYALAETEGEVRLAVLRASSGRLEWSLLLAVPEQAVLSDPQRRLAGAAPSLAGDVLVCPTSAGAVVAVDPVTRSILWGHQVPLTQDTSRAVRLRMAGIRVGGRDSGRANSIDATALIAQGRVLVAPVESDDLICLDLASGELCWRRPVEDLLYVACVEGDTVMAVGCRSVSGWRLGSGKPAWQSLAVELPEGANTAGRGFQAGRRYYVPTTAPDVLEIDVATGRIEKRLPLKGAAGNLMAVGPLVVSQSAESVEAFGAAP